jgi:hypothetical protein
MFARQDVFPQNPRLNLKTWTFSGIFFLLCLGFWGFKSPGPNLDLYTSLHTVKFLKTTIASGGNGIKCWGVLMVEIWEEMTWRKIVQQGRSL